MKEEDLWTTDRKALMKLDGKDETWILPGLAALIGSKGSVSFLKGIVYLF